MKRLIHGEALAEMSKMDENSIDLTVTSPPYDATRTAYKQQTLDELVAVYTQLLHITTNGGVFCLNIRDGWVKGAYTGTTFRLVVALLDAGWRLHTDIIASKDGRPGAWFNKRFKIDHEYVFNFVKGDEPQYFNKESLKIVAKWAGTKYHGTQRKSDGTLDPIVGDYTIKSMKCRGTVWPYRVGGGQDDDLGHKHPAIMPKNLARDLILCFSEPGMTVLDPMAGSGTTLLQARNLGRNYLGIEISEEYCALIEERLKQPTSDHSNKGVQKRW